MKKLLVLLAAFSATPAWAIHEFKVCYYNWTNSSISYNNNGISHKWKTRGELNGSGTIAPGKNRCFTGIADETIFASHYLTFTVADQWVGLVNPPFSRPYIIEQNARAKSGARLPESIDKGHDDYTLYVHVMDNTPSIILSGSTNPRDTDQQIVPRMFK